jgi:hypothetical protein
MIPPLEIIVLLVMLGLLSKTLDSTLGLGYGTMLAPILLLLGYPVTRVVPAVLLSEFLSAAITALFHRAMGNIASDSESRDFKVFTLLSVMGVLGGLAGVAIAFSSTDMFVTVYVSLTVIVTGLFVVRGFRWIFTWKRITLFGFIASLNKSISGGGYGPIVAGGQILTGRDGTKAIGTTSIAEAATTATSYILYEVLGRTPVTLDTFLGLEGPLLLGALLSAPISAYILKKVDPRRLIPIVGSAAVLLGLYTLMSTVFDSTIATIIVLAIFSVLVLGLLLVRANGSAHKQRRDKEETQ